jgi:glucose uptake protein GlcU
MRNDPSDAAIAAQVLGTTVGVIVVVYVISLFTEASSGERLSAVISCVLALVGIATAVSLIGQFKQMRKATVAASDAG